MWFAASMQHSNFAFAHLVMILHELDDDPDVVAVVLDGYHSHNVRSILNTNICHMKQNIM